jgi:hypothetical protein
MTARVCRGIIVALVFLAIYTPASAEMIITGVSLSMELAVLRPEKGDEYTLLVTVHNHTQERTHFNVVLFHGAQDWDTQSLHFIPLRDGGTIIVSRCRPGRKVPFCRVDWEADIAPGGELTLTLTAHVPAQTRFGAVQHSILITEATLYQNDMPLSDQSYRVEVTRPLITLWSGSRPILTGDMSWNQ